MKNHLAKVQQALLAGRHGVNGLGGYHQTNCNTSIPNTGLFRIYRDPNILYNTTSTSTSTKTYSYTGNVQSVSLTAGTHVIECWGANGGSGNKAAGGTGGYSKGTLTINSTATYYICVGGKGTSDPNSAGYYPGGYNGGGQSYGGNGGRGAGGGATHVASVTGVLSSLSGNKSAVKIVAGGGGGGFQFNSGAYAGGNGGGVTGMNGYGSAATGGTQTAAGTNSSTSYTAPGFGYGGQVPSTSVNTVAGGGAGYYGGGCGNSGAGGSGYVGGVTGGVTYQKTESGFVANPDTSGNGYVRITSTVQVPTTNRTMYGGLCIDNANNRFGLMKGHTYIILFNITGKSTNAPAHYTWANNMGWEGGGLEPRPSNTEYNIPGANFNQSTNFPFYYKWTITDDIYKVCTSSYASFTAGTTYLSYRHFQFGFEYADTGSLGTDLYISNFRLYDITNKPDFSIEKDGIINAPILYRSDETVKIDKRYDIAHLIANNFYEI